MNQATVQASQPRGTIIHWARAYDVLNGIVPFLRALRAKLIELAAPVHGEQVLDVGCGPGTLAVAFEKRAGGGKVQGIDASPEMIAVAKSKAAKAGVDVAFQVASIAELPFAAASFDLVTSSLMLHHLPGDVKRKGLAETRRVLKPGGRLLVVDFARPSHSRVGHLLSLFGHAHGVSTADDLGPMLKEAGYGEVEVIPSRHRRFVFIRAR
jgi:ubiquinone/menaquinone biosynthesis C-methylase UbiE